MLLSQVPFRLVPSTPAEEAVVRGAEAVTAALRGIFHLDPVPQLMRDYVPERDDELRRTGENLSAAVGRLRNDDEMAFNQLKTLIAEIADHRVRDLDLTGSPLGDVMLGVTEVDSFTPAREMSDGLLRFMAIAVALLAPNNDLDIARALSESGMNSSVTLVIEELENGLHPSQAERALHLIRDASRDLVKRVVFTTHSPALLNAMTGELNGSVLVCYRDEKTGASHLSRITELPGYAEALASGPMGDAITRDRLTRPTDFTPDHQEFDRLLGIDLTA
jgi:predicted ATPase